MSVYAAFEGIDTVGKSTQIARVAEGFDDVLVTKEPGGTPLGRKIRTLLLDEGGAHPRAETLLFLADRAEHIEKVVRPNLGRLILSDRSLISGIAYAHVHDGIDMDRLIDLNLFAVGGLLPDVAVYFTIDEATLRARLGEKARDAVERRGIDYMMAVQRTMAAVIERLEIPALHIDAAAPVEKITDTITTFLKERP